MEPMYVFLTALIVALAAAGGLHLLRRFAWNAALTMGYMALAAIGFLVLAGVIVGVGSAGKGGDAGMYAMFAVIIGGIGLLLAALLAALSGAAVGRSLKRPFGASFVTAMIDPVLFAIVVWWFLGTYIPLLHRGRADDWRKEVATRKRQIEELASAIPAPYRNMPPEMIAQHNQMRAQFEKQGMPQDRLAPADVEAKMFELRRLRQMPPPAADLSRFREIEEIRTKGLWGLCAGWLAGLFLLPLAGRFRRQTPTPA